MPDRHARPIHALAAHPSTPGEAVRRIAVRADAAGADSLRFCYLLDADLRRLRIPPAAAEGFGERLWAHTCFEAFLRVGDSPRYLELNFSPSGEWAAYSFDAYRQGMASASLGAAPRLEVRRTPDGLQLEAKVPLRAWLPPGRTGSAEAPSRPGSLRIALSAVVEDGEGGLSYWALRHPPGRPDFHHPDAFALTLELPG